MGGFGDDEDEDMFSDDSEDDSDDDDSDMGAEPPASSHVRPVSHADHSREKTGKRRVRLRPMTPKMRVKHPDAVSIAITRNDGRQLIFVR